MTTNSAANSVTPSTLGRSLVAMPSTAYLPRPLSEKTRLGEDGAADQQAEVQAEDREDRGERAAQPVLDDDRRSCRPFARAVRM